MGVLKQQTGRQAAQAQEQAGRPGRDEPLRKSTASVSGVGGQC